MANSFELTMEELRRRIAAAGITIREERLELVRKLLSEALAPVHALDSRANIELEPAVRFSHEAEDD